MKGILFIVTVAGAFPASNAPVKLDSGQVGGVAGGTPERQIFKGIPFAAPPVGNLRWRAAARTKTRYSSATKRGWVRRRTRRSSRFSRLTISCMRSRLGVFLFLPSLFAQSGKTPAADWPMFKRDPASTRYSPLTQVTTANVEARTGVDVSPAAVQFPLRHGRRRQNKVCSVRASNPSDKRRAEPGSGTPLTFTVPPDVANSMPSPKESNATHVKESDRARPGTERCEAKCCKSPPPSRREQAPVSESALKVMVPPTLSIVPGKKIVPPAPGRKGPSVIGLAARIAGSNPMSN